jgi:4-carboxymuconolactone decarboxylase
MTQIHFSRSISGRSIRATSSRRCAVSSKSLYEWAQHVRIGKQSGLTDEEVHRIKIGPTAKGWSERDVLLLRATDELRKDACISDATWQGLGKYYNAQQLMDIVFAVGQYNLVSMALNTLGVQLDPGLTTTFENT